ncbi:MAG TPA: universal stress protein [Thermoanaerobaculia bacterium]|nr:universal stress protein [Thermoanaerobaculia bacterium]HXK66947.1 universal stress protein [Thermoanaerobaculia bacterium]
METHYHRILVPLDFSKTSEFAFAHAYRLACDYGSTLLLLTVLDDRFPYPEIFSFDQPNEDYFHHLRDRARHHIEELVQAMGRCELPYEILILRGDPSREILDVASREGVDLIVMATHGTTGLTHYLLGSVTDKVVRKAPCPVLVVRKKESIG